MAKCFLGAKSSPTENYWVYISFYSFNITGYYDDYLPQ